MILYVTGGCDSANMIRQTLGQKGFTVRAMNPPPWAVMTNYLHLMIEEDAVRWECCPTCGAKPSPAVDGVNSTLETEVMNQIAELSLSGQVRVLRAGGVRNDRALRIVIPARDEERATAVTAVYRALSQVVKS